MKSPAQIVLVLWGEGFDEIAATLFVAGLRRLGKRVQLAGFNHQQCAGQHGLTLVPDLPLGQALAIADSVRCIIIPARLATLQQFSYDPRLAELFDLVCRRQALIVASAPCPRFADLNPLLYPNADELLSFIRTILAPRLSDESPLLKDEPPHPNNKAPHLNDKR